VTSLVRLGPDGNRDDSYQAGFTFRGGASSPAVDDQGRTTFVVDGAIARVTPDLQLDTTFADDGRLPIPSGFGGGGALEPVLTLADDDTILLGSTDGVFRFATTDPVQRSLDGIIHVEGGTGDDDVSAVLDGRFLNVTFDGEVFTFRTSRVTGIEVFTREGNDSVDLAIDLPVTVSTSFGDDMIRVAGTAAASIMSGEGADSVQTGDGDDTIFAGGRATILSGGGGDTIESQDPERITRSSPWRGPRRTSRSTWARATTRSTQATPSASPGAARATT
jgi:hypothetical protein